MMIIPFILFNMFLFLKIDRNIKDLIITVDALFLLFLSPFLVRVIIMTGVFLFLAVSFKNTCRIIKENYFMFLVLMTAAVYFYFFYSVVNIFPVYVLYHFPEEKILVLLYLVIIYLSVKTVYGFTNKKI